MFRLDGVKINLNFKRPTMIFKNIIMPGAHMVKVVGCFYVKDHRLILKNVWDELVHSIVLDE